jgi:hypothetical protein
MGVKGDAMSLFGPLVMASARMPIFCMPSEKLNVCISTPMEPVTVVGWAMISSAPHAT